MPRLGPILDITPERAAAGAKIRVSTERTNVRLDHADDVWFEPVRQSAGSGFGVTVLGRRAQYTVIDQSTLEVEVPALAPEFQPGRYVVVVKGGWSVAHGKTPIGVTRAAATSGTSRPGTSAGRVPGTPIATVGGGSPVPGVSIGTGASASMASPPGRGPRLPTGISKLQRLTYGRSPSSKPGATGKLQTMPGKPLVVTASHGGPSQTGLPPLSISGPSNTPADGSAPTSGERIQWRVETFWPQLDNAQQINGYRTVVSIQNFDREDEPIFGRPVTLTLMPESLLGPDVAAIRAATTGLSEALSPSSLGPATTSASIVTNEEGKAYFLLDLKLWQADELPAAALHLQGLRLTFEEEVDDELEGDSKGMGEGFAAPWQALQTTPRRAPHTVTSDEDGWFDKIEDIFVEQATRVIVTGVKLVGGVPTAIAGITRVKDRVIGQALHAIGDAMDAAHALPIPDQVAFPDPETGQWKQYPIGPDEKKALRLGLLLGATRGVWGAGRDKVEEFADFYELARMGATLVRKFYEFATDDPKFAAQIVTTLTLPSAGLVFYECDDEFKQRINKFILKYLPEAAQKAQILAQIAGAVADHPKAIFLSIARYLYKNFEKKVAFIPRDYLGYSVGSNPFNYFIVSFLCADVVAFIGVTIGIEVLLAWVTSGIAAYAKGLAIAGKVAGGARKLVRVIQELYRVFAKAGRVLKKTACTALVALIKFIGELPGRHFSSVLEVITDHSKSFAVFLGRHLEDSGRTIGGVLDAYRDPQMKSADVADSIQTLSYWCDGLNANGIQVRKAGEGLVLPC